MKPKHIVTYIAAIALAALGGACLVSCSTVGIQPSFTKSVTALQPSVDAIISDLGGGQKLTSGNLLATGLQAATAEVQTNVNNPALSQILTDAITTYAGDPSLKQPAQDLVNLATKDGGNAETLVGNLVNAGVAASNAANN